MYQREHLVIDFLNCPYACAVIARGVYTSMVMGKIVMHQTMVRRKAKLLGCSLRNLRITGLIQLLFC